jgi:hypothetical protein
MRPAHGLLLLLVCLLFAAWAFAPRGTASGAVAGLVTDDRGPVSGARVRFQGHGSVALTGPDGRFRLPRPAKGTARVVAWKEGYRIEGTNLEALPLTLTLNRLPEEDWPDYSWVDPAPDPAAANNCGNCHGDIFREWQASAHARSATNRRFLNLFDGSDWHGRPGVGWNLSAEHPDGRGVCAVCHAPTLTDPGGDYDPRAARAVAARGVHCDYCHKVTEAPTGTLGITFGRDAMRLLRPRGEQQLFFGPLDDAQRAGESFAFSPLYRDSRYCAACHEATVFGVHVYSTYTEWLDSPARRAGQQCQSCHMTPTGTLTNIAPGKGGIERDPQTLASHQFPGGNPEMLRRCLSVSARLARDAAGVRAEVEVRADGVGHRVPTGFIDRNLLLVVEAQDGAGAPVPARAGPALPPTAGRGVAGLPGRLYAKRLSDPQGRSPIPFWRAHDEPEDNRLFPGRPDRSAFAFPAAAARVRVRLLYRRFWQEVAEDKGWPDNEITVADRTFQSPPG